MFTEAAMKPASVSMACRGSPVLEPTDWSITQDIQVANRKLPRQRLFCPRRGPAQLPASWVGTQPTVNGPACRAFADLNDYFCSDPDRASAKCSQCRPACISCLRSKFPFDTQELVVFRSAVGTSEGTSLDLTATGGNRKIGDRCIFGLSRTVGYDGCICGLVG